MVLALLTSSGLCLPGSQVRIRLGLWRALWLFQGGAAVQPLLC